MNKKLESKKIAIIGSGVVGQASGKGFKNIGHEITFYDINYDKIDSLKVIGYDADHINNLAKRDDEYSAYMMSIPTPTMRGQADLTALRHALKQLGKKLATAKNYPIVVLRSTVPPGTSQNVAMPVLEKISGKKCGVDFGLCMNPEFLREASSEKDFAQPWVTVIGSDNKSSGLILEDIYKPFKSPVIHMTLMEAEMMKYTHNLFNATKISFFNEMRLVCKRLGVDPDTVFQSAVQSAEGSWNPQYGIRDFGPYSGACLPKDTTAFYEWSSQALQIELPVLRGTIETNEMIKARETEKVPSEHDQIREKAMMQ